LNTTIFISQRFQEAMRRKKAVGTTIRNFRRLFHRSDRGGETLPYRQQGQILSPKRPQTLLRRPSAQKGEEDLAEGKTSDLAVEGEVVFHHYFCDTFLLFEPVILLPQLDFW
jgi:hypothetical protein